MDVIYKKIFQTKTYEELVEIKKKSDLDTSQITDLTNTTQSAKKVDLSMIREAENLSVEQMQANQDLMQQHAFAEIN